MIRKKKGKIEEPDKGREKLFDMLRRLEISSAL